MIHLLLEQALAQEDRKVFWMVIHAISYSVDISSSLVTTNQLWQPFLTSIWKTAMPVLHDQKLFQHTILSNFSQKAWHTAHKSTSDTIRSLSKISITYWYQYSGAIILSQCK